MDTEEKLRDYLKRATTGGVTTHHIRTQGNALEVYGADGLLQRKSLAGGRSPRGPSRPRRFRRAGPQWVEAARRAHLALRLCATNGGKMGLSLGTPTILTLPSRSVTFSPPMPVGGEAPSAARLGWTTG